MKRFLFLIAFSHLMVASFSQSHQLNVAGSGIFEPIDVFDLEYITDPQISPDGTRIIYVRNYNDILTDKTYANLWIIGFDGKDNRPLTTGNQRDYSPRWSPDGKKFIYLSNKDGKSQMYLRWLDDGTEARISNLTKSPSGISWSPDGRWIAFTMNVDEDPASLGKMPKKPEGAVWAAAPKYIDKMVYRRDGQGFLRDDYRQIFMISADGGTPRQLTYGPFDHGGEPQWSPDGKSIYFSANRHENHEYETRNSEIYSLSVADASISQLTDRWGPDENPKISPDGKTVAYLGFDDELQGYQVSKCYLMDADGKNIKMISGNLDRDVDGIQWSGDGKGLYFRYDDNGHTKLAFMDRQGKVTELAKNLGGLSIGRPYTGSSFSVSGGGRFAYTHGQPDHPSDLASGSKDGINPGRLTRVNEDLFAYKKLGKVEEILYKSSFDGREIQGWICYPPDFDPSKKYPFILEIHGGPFQNYGDRFSAEVQLFAAAGYVVLYTNPRGSTSYGEEFGNLIHHNYPGQDYDDLISGVDAVIAKGFIDEDNLFVTGGSGGGVLTAWIIGKTDRFRAAVVAKPVINWYSFVLHADAPGFFYKYWFPGPPWENEEHYMKRSPISLVGNVKTPTMLLTGEQDYRTPMSETEQYYAALKINKVESAMVRIQDSGHGIASKPSNLIAKVVYILAWFEKYKKP